MSQHVEMDMFDASLLRRPGETSTYINEWNDVCGGICIWSQCEE